MFRVLAFKEIRECLVVLVLALVAFLYFAATCAGFSLTPNTNSLRTILFVAPSSAPSFAMLAGVFAIALGLKQSAWEFDRSSSLFLLHRPIERWQLISTKLAVGLVLLWAVCALPVLLLGCWATVPGNQAAPFFWSMTLECWQTVLSVSVVYLGAFLSGMRPARWFGTRLLPTLGAIAVAVLIQLLPAWWLLGVIAVLATDLVLTETIFVTANSRDYS